MRIIFAMAAIPLVVYFGVPSSQRPVAIAAKAVEPEGIREARMDATTFRLRWSVVSDLPPMREIVQEPLLLIHHEGAARNDERQTVGATVSARPRQEVRHDRVNVSVASSAGAVVSSKEPPAPPPSRRLHSRPAQLDICAKHKMRKVHYGRTWRCRR